jgi:hypothetical protein
LQENMCKGGRMEHEGIEEVERGEKGERGKRRG